MVAAKRRPGRPAATPPAPVGLPPAPPLACLPADGLADVNEAARFLRVCTKTVRNLISGGELGAKRIGRRVLVPWTALRAFANATD